MKKVNLVSNSEGSPPTSSLPRKQGKISSGLKQIKKELENDTALIQCANEFNMVGDPTRLKICYLLCRHKELPVGEIAEIVGVSISAVSHTLRKLKETNMVESRRDFRHVFYKLKPSPLRDYLEERFTIV